MKRCLSHLTAFQRSEAGAVAIIFGLACLPLIAAAGFAVDYSRSAKERGEIQNALDAGVLAGAILNLPDDQRTKRAQDVFYGALPSPTKAHLTSVSFGLDAGKTRVIGSANAVVSTTLSRVMGHETLSIGAQSQSVIARPQIRQLDLVMCIDATGSMTPTINAVKSNALNFEANLNAELKKRQIDPFDVMRVRAIFYRDFGGNSYYDPLNGGWAYTKSGWKWIDKSDPDKGKYVGDDPPLNTSKFFELPAKRTDLADFVNAESAWGGGDEPEAGLECVNEAMNSKFAQVGDSIGGGKKLTGVYPTIVVWTDANAHPPSHALSLKNPHYPPASDMPRTHADLLAKWNDVKTLDQANKMLVFFGGPGTWGTSVDPNGWPPVTKWPGYYAGGTLADGNTQMVSRLADALASKVMTPTITH
jgi:Flp pilus assembly protein TadG